MTLWIAVRDLWEATGLELPGPPPCTFANLFAADLICLRRPRVQAVSQLFLSPLGLVVCECVDFCVGTRFGSQAPA